MKKINIVKSNDDFSRIITTVDPYRNKDFNIYLERNTDDIYHFGFSIGTKIGNAVTRNKLRRQIKTLIDKKEYQKGFNCIIMVKRTIVEKSYEEIEESLFEIINRIGIIKGD